MKYRTIGGTDIVASVICLGPMRAAARSPGDDEKSRLGEAALRRVLDGGVNFIHSSYEYGTRWMLERVLKDHPRRGELHHVIKVPVPDFQDGDRFDPAEFRLRVEEALRDLHAERIAILQYMWRSDPNTDERRLPLLAQVLPEVVQTFETMRDEGKVGHLFTFPYTVPCGRAAIETGRFDGLIAYYNPCEMEMADLFDDLQRRGMGFLCIRPLYQGILTDRFVSPEDAPDGHRLSDPRHAAEFSKRAKVVEAFRDQIGDSLVSFAIRFALAHPVVASVIVGINTPQQADGLLEAADGKYPPVEVVEQARELWRNELAEM